MIEGSVTVERVAHRLGYRRREARRALSNLRLRGWVKPSGEGFRLTRSVERQTTIDADIETV